MFDKGFFGGLFDFNGDGKLDAFERAADFMAFQELMNGDKEKEDDNTESSDTVESSGFGIADYDELAEAGLDRDELEYMDEDERMEALEDAGLDPDDYEF